MIRVMVGSRTPRRSAPSAVLIGLVLLVASHLLGALHGPGFVGAHLPFPTGGTPAPTVLAQPSPAPSHGHDHDCFDDSVEHAIDRVRVTVDRPAHAPQPAEPLTELPVTVPRPDHACPRDDTSTHGRAACTRHCVWRL